MFSVFPSDTRSLTVKGKEKGISGIGKVTLHIIFVKLGFILLI